MKNISARIKLHVDHAIHNGLIGMAYINKRAWAIRGVRDPVWNSISDVRSVIIQKLERP